jgi:hypothetical protein
MHSWNPEEVEQAYPAQSLGFLTRVSEKPREYQNRESVAQTVRALVKTTGADPHSSKTMQQAWTIAEEAEKHESSPPYTRPEHGYIINWISEIWDEATLKGALDSC